MQKRKILVIDDNEYDRVLIERSLLKSEGCSWDVNQCSSVREASMRVHQEHFDCVLVDYMLPDENGIEFLKRFRKFDFQTPIVLITGSGSESIAIEAFKNGAQDYVIKSKINDKNLSEVLIQAIGRKEGEVAIIRKANFDPLTGLVNRNILPDRIDQAIIRADRNRMPFALVYIDLNKFKSMNDTYGHDAGDMILKAVAERLMRSVRSGDTVARVGGDEFVAVIEGVSNDRAKNYSTAIGRMVEAISGTSINIGDHNVFITGSIGVALYPMAAKKREDLLRAADRAMYRAKKSGDGMVCYAEEADGMTAPNVMAS